MNCSKVQELLLTDYLDGEISVKLKMQVDEHIKNCSVCQKFSVAVDESVVHVFEDDKHVDAPQYLWHQIQRKIVSQAGVAPKRRFFPSIFDIFLLIPRPVLITAAVMIFVFGNFAVMHFTVRKIVSVDSQAILNYLENIDDFAVDSPDLGTQVERDML